MLLVQSCFKMSSNLSRTARTESNLDDHLVTQSFFKDKDELTMKKLRMQIMNNSKKIIVVDDGVYGIIYDKV